MLKMKYNGGRFRTRTPEGRNRRYISSIAHFSSPPRDAHIPQLRTSTTILSPEGPELLGTTHCNIFGLLDETVSAHLDILQEYLGVTDRFASMARVGPHALRLLRCLWKRVESTEHRGVFLNFDSQTTTTT